MSRSTPISGFYDLSNLRVPGADVALLVQLSFQAFEELREGVFEGDHQRAQYAEFAESPGAPIVDPAR